MNKTALFRPSKPTNKKAQASTKLPPATVTNINISEATSGSGQNRKSPEKPSKKNTLFDDISDDDDEADLPISKSRPKSNPVVVETKKKEPVKKPTKGNKSDLIFEGTFHFFGTILKKSTKSLPLNFLAYYGKKR